MGLRNCIIENSGKFWSRGLIRVENLRQEEKELSFLGQNLVAIRNGFNVKGLIAFSIAGEGLA